VIQEPPLDYAPGEMPLSVARRRGHLTTRLKVENPDPPAYLKERGRKGGLATQARRRARLLADPSLGDSGEKR
jgi:hypothetical protein